MNQKTFVSLLSSVVLSFGFAVASQAAVVTGDPQTNTFGWDPNSTNALNYALLVPGSEGQAVPYVLFNSNAPGSVTLDFFNVTNSLAFFETRIDGIATGSTNHPIVTGDKIHTGGTSVDNRAPTFVSYVMRTFNATSYVDIRLALGGERDWDFDWTRFYVAPAPVPLPAAAWLLISGLAGLGVFARRKAS